MNRSGKILKQNEFVSINSDSSIVSLLSTDESDDENEEFCSLPSEDDNGTIDFKNEHGAYHQEEKSDIIIARVLGPPCACRKKCRSKLFKNHEIVIFSRFWNLKSNYLQNCYLYDNITIGKPHKSITRNERRESRRTITVYYSVDNGNGDSVNVCKTEFLSLHGIQNSLSRINTIVKRKKCGLTVNGTRKDRREKSHGGSVRPRKAQ